MIFDDWYPALRSADLRGKSLSKALLLGVPLVLGRKRDGSIFAMRDLCPHRGIPLSAGWFDGEHVTCKYHGWSFEPCSGQCSAIPSLTPGDELDATKIYATAYPCVERDGYAWVYLPSAGTGRLQDMSALPPVPELPKFSQRFHTAHLSAELPCNVDHGIIGLMDPAHGPFVHQSWWWRSSKSIHEKAKNFEPIAGGFRMSAHKPSSNSAPYKLLGGAPVTTIDFTLPNRRYETIRAGKHWFTSMTTVTPVTPTTCRIDVYAAWNILYWVPLVPQILKFFARIFVGQDAQTMVEQAEGLRFHPGLMLIDDADKPAKWYFALKQSRLEGKNENPLKGPVTLRWRS
jgi:phenylpropionate dioxygenase-like ring-hydroxylating dioxygenase large terminal subunit